MKRYRVTGTIELNFENIVYADSEEDAIELGAGYAEDGSGLGCPVCSPDPYDTEAEEIAEDEL